VHRTPTTLNRFVLLQKETPQKREVFRFPEDRAESRPMGCLGARRVGRQRACARWYRSVSNFVGRRLLACTHTLTPSWPRTSRKTGEYRQFFTWSNCCLFREASILLCLSPRRLQATVRPTTRVKMMSFSNLAEQPRHKTNFQAHTSCSPSQSTPVSPPPPVFSCPCSTAPLHAGSGARLRVFEGSHFAGAPRDSKL
jgi:hypothetical protein